jgi:hypothetical protein
MTPHLASALILLIAACSPGPAPVSRSMRDPSNPSAPEGVLPATASPANEHPVGTPRDANGGSEQAGHTHHHHGTTSPRPEGAARDAGTPASVYVCPMHPEVTSPAPGRCPKCGMDLVPKK